EVDPAQASEREQSSHSSGESRQSSAPKLRRNDVSYGSVDNEKADKRRRRDKGERDEAARDRGGDRTIGELQEDARNPPRDDADGHSTHRPSVGCVGELAGAQADQAG